MSSDLDKTLLDVHAWGGLAGQLSALSTCLWIEEHLARETRLVFHEGGVSRRPLVIGPLMQGIPVKIVSEPFEFNLDGSPGPHPGLSRRLLLRLRRGRLAFLSSVGLAVVGDSLGKEALQALPRRVGTVFGYPSDWRIMGETSSAIANRLSSATIPNFLAHAGEEDSIAVHWRLGDYLASSRTLATHGLVSPVELAQAIKALPEEIPIKVFSDSPELVEYSLRGSTMLAQRAEVILEPDIWKTMFKMTRSRYFIGTNSGISMWAALAVDRAGGKTLLPELSSRLRSGSEPSLGHLRYSGTYRARLDWSPRSFSPVL